MKLDFLKSCLIVFVLLLSACSSYSVTDIDKPITGAAEPTLIANGVNYIGSASEESSVESFLGVPFAQPPVGSLRWKPPAPLQAVRGSALVSTTAKSFAPSCMQGPHLLNWYKGVITSFGGDPESFPAAEVSEDCLYLNVWRPTLEQQQEPLPVLVFIHGGSNKGGWSYEPNYIGEELAKRGIIVVTVAYRLGVFGFFSHPESEQSNFALLDQISALQWVQNNIAAAGGDTNRVTVAGESAGASDISYLMASPLAKGLFHRAIHQSGGWAMRGIRGKGDNAKLGEKLAAAVADGEKISLDQLREVDAQKVLDASHDIYRGHFFDPVEDGRSLTQSLPGTIADGELHKVDLIIGSNANEARMYLDPEQTVDGWIAENVATEDAANVKALLPEDASRVEVLDMLSTAYSYACPSHALAAANADNGGRSWVYYFSRVREGKLAEEMGAYHGAELPYMFNTHDEWLPSNDEDHATTEVVMDYWAQFVRTGNPNSERIPDWPAYQKHGDKLQNLNTVARSERHVSEALCNYLMP